MQFYSFLGDISTLINNDSINLSCNEGNFVLYDFGTAQNGEILFKAQVLNGDDFVNVSVQYDNLQVSNIFNFFSG